jgi:undecaprenyl diphosphate synthase
MTAMPPAPAPVPRHLAVIMDGNGRWAERRRRPRIIGHRAGARAVNVCIDFCLERGVRALTLFAFSSENWGRPLEEVGALMKLFMNALDREVEELDRRGVRVRFIGDRERFSAGICERMSAAENQTRANTRLDLVIAASYGGRQAACAQRTSMKRRSPRKWRWPTCHLPIFSSVPAATSASAISCCGSWPIPNSGSPNCCGRNSIPPPCSWQ